MYTHNLDPVLLDFGFIAIRWYSLAYILEFLLVGGWEKNNYQIFKNIILNLILKNLMI
jgi:prolipoprotein diacylglyceryltransferase